MRLLIFGAGGFIGSHLAREAIVQGHDVVGLSRSGRIPKFHGESIRWRFGEQLPQSALKGVDCAVHLAHDFEGDSGAALTIEATMQSVSLLRDAGVPRQIFFSSYSAGEHATSLYGRSKFIIEQSLSHSDDVTIIRPGLVLGDGGIYARIVKLVRRLPVIPLPDGGRGVVPVITIDRLCQETISIAKSSFHVRQANLFEPEFRSLRELVKKTAEEVESHPVILPIPTKWMMAGMQTADFFRIRLSVNTDNLAGFIANQRTSHISSLQR